MARKAGIIATTILLGKVDGGWIAWFVITSITFLAIALQLLMVPFPDEKNVKMSGILFECAPVREQQSRGLRKVYAMTATTCSEMLAYSFIFVFLDDVQDVCPTQSGPCSPVAKLLLAIKNPGLNDLQLAGLICQIVTLFCGLMCVTIGKEDQMTNFVLGCCSLTAMGCFVGLVLHVRSTTNPLLTTQLSILRASRQLIWQDVCERANIPGM